MVDFKGIKALKGCLKFVDPDLECTRNTAALTRPSWELIRHSTLPNLQKVLVWSGWWMRTISPTAINSLLWAKLDFPANRWRSLSSVGYSNLHHFQKWVGLRHYTATVRFACSLDEIISGSISEVARRSGSWRKLRPVIICIRVSGLLQIISCEVVSGSEFSVASTSVSTVNSSSYFNLLWPMTFRKHLFTEPTNLSKHPPDHGSLLSIETPFNSHPSKEFSNCSMDLIQFLVGWFERLAIVWNDFVWCSSSGHEPLKASDKWVCSNVKN